MSSEASPAPPHCYVHPDRLAGSVCRRCGRPICPDCMHEAPVGWQCTSCLRQGARTSPTIRWRPRTAGRLGNTRMTPVVGTLIIVNIAVYIWEQHTASHVVARFAMWPNGVHTRHEWYRLMTAAFLHANLQHIIFNMATLAIIGPPVEAELGKLRFAVLYFASALGGSVGSYLLSNAAELGVGASGAIFGLMGAYFVLARRRRWDTSVILGLILVNLLIGFSGNIDWRAHIGGLVTGAAVAFGFGRTADLSRTRRTSPAGEAVLGGAVAVVVFAVLGLLVLLPPGKVNL